MKNKLSLGLVVMACVALLVSGAMGASVFFSEIGEVGGGVTPGNPVVDGTGREVTLYICPWLQRWHRGAVPEPGHAL